VLFTLGGGVGLLFLVGRGTFILFPELADGLRVQGLFILMGFPLIISVVVVGLLMGSVLWLLAMKPWFDRDEMASYFTEPEIPFFTSLMTRVFNLLYPPDGG
jgi:hypothetical protein